jgi:hypothetical protein
MRESRTFGSVGGEGGNVLAYPAIVQARFHTVWAQSGRSRSLRVCASITHGD